METDAGRAVMKTPATKAKDLFKVVLPTSVAVTLSISWAVDNDLVTKYSKSSICSVRSYPYHADITYQLHSVGSVV